MKRFGAVAVAVAMIAVSLLIRARIDDGGGGSSTPPNDSGRPVIACVTELADACTQAYGGSAEVRVEEARTTALALAKGSAGIDAWVTLSGWPELVAAKGGNPTLGVTPVASTALVIAAVKERVATLACTAQGWSCFLSSVGKPWGELGGSATWGALRVGLPLTSSASGLLLEASAITGLAGTVDVGTNDPAYSEARGLLARVEQEPDAFGAFAVQLPARFSAVGALEVDVTNRSGAKASQITTVPLTPGASAIAVVARVAGGRRIDPAKLSKPLADVGWKVPPADSAGLLDGGVLLALAGI